MDLYEQIASQYGEITGEESRCGPAKAFLAELRRRHPFSSVLDVACGTGLHAVMLAEMGAAVTAVLFTTGKFLMGLYLGKGALTSTYGAAGSFAAVLMWVYYSALVLYFGAEFTKAFADRYGSRRSKPL